MALFQTLKVLRGEEFSLWTIRALSSGLRARPTASSSRSRWDAPTTSVHSAARTKACALEQRRVFLTDGDALILPQARLLKILKAIRERLPWVTRVGVYGNAKSIRTKTLEDLIALHEQGLGIVYMGLESGDDVTLKKMRKGVGADTIIKMGRRVMEAGIKLSVTVLLGLAGPERSDVHAEATGRALSAMDPEYVGALSLMLLPNTPLGRDYAEGRFRLVSPMEMLRELKTMIAHTDLSGGLFYANHASNYLPIKARLPRDQEAAVSLIDQALRGDVPLKPEFMRAL